MLEPDHSSPAYYIRFLTMQSLDEYWSPADMGEWKFISLKDIPHCVSEYIQWSSSYPARPVLSVHASPFQEGLYTIWVHFHFTGPAPSDMPVLTVYKYCLSLSSATSDLLCLRSFSAPVGRGYTDITHISYSGHTHIYDYVTGVHRVFALPELDRIITTGADDVIELPDSADQVHISTYSGALTYSTHEFILVDYYM